MIASRLTNNYRLFPTTKLYTSGHSDYFLSKDWEFLSRKKLEKWDWKILAPYELSRWKS
jgi:hypothetical protein